MKRIFMVFLSGVLASGVFAAGVFAADFGGVGGRPQHPDPAVPHSDQWFIYTINPGESKDDAVVVQNNDDKPVEIMLYATDSTPSTDGGFALKQMVEPKTGVGSWITLSKDRITLAAHESVAVPFRINVPKDSSVDVGEHSGGILIQKVQKEEASPTGGMQLLTRVGVRVYITIPGDIIKKLAIDQLTLDYNSQNRTYTANITIKNLGNVSQDVVIDTTVNNALPWLGWFFKNFPLKNQRNFQVLRDTSFTSHFEFPRPLFGKFQALATATYDDGKQVLMASPAIITVMPEKNVIILALLVLASIAFFVARK